MTAGRPGTPSAGRARCAASHMSHEPACLPDCHVRPACKHGAINIRPFRVMHVCKRGELHQGAAAGSPPGPRPVPPCAAGGRCNLLVCSCLSTSPPCDVPWPTPILHCPVPARHHFIRRLQGRFPPLELPSASAHASTASFHENTRTVVAIRTAARPVSHIFCIYVK